MNKDQKKEQNDEDKVEAQEVVGNIAGENDIAKKGKIRKMSDTSRAVLGGLKDRVKKPF